jgi:3-oxoacyl-[acyl-carrier protein] reductase
VGEILKGQVAIVTGAGQGIGESIARSLAQGGAAVVIADVNEVVAAKVAADLQGEGAAALAITCDVADPDAVDAMVQATVEAFGDRIAVLVNSAGGMLGAKKRPVEEVFDEEWHRVLTVNLTGSFYTARAVVPYMKAHRYGRILNISSGAGRSHSRTGIHAYTAAKAGVHGLTRQLAVELGSFNITVNALAPGLILSPLGASTWAERTEEQRQEVLRSIAMGRLGDPQEIADVAAFLVGPQGGYITGQTVGVDGGHWMF